MSATKLTADEVQAVMDGLGETGSAWLKVDDLGNGGLYSKREENADTRFHGTVADVDEARVVLDAPNHTPWPAAAPRQQISTVEQARAAGEADGREAVTCYVNENGGVEALFDAQGAWDEPAINACAHRSAGIDDDATDLRAAYYEAYAQAAEAYEAELLAEGDDSHLLAADVANLERQPLPPPDKVVDGIGVYRGTRGGQRA